MKKIIYLFFALLIFSCSSEEDEPVCLVCTNMDFWVPDVISGLGGSINCAFAEGEPQCEGASISSMCYPNRVLARPLDKASLYKIKRFWEENGAICTLK